MFDLESRAAIPVGPQFRSYPAEFEVRGQAGSRVELRGYASTYDRPYDMFDMFGEYTETARSGMCAKTLRDGADVNYLANHEGLTLARTKSGTLHLSEDSTGLEAIATLNTSRSDARDLVTAVEDGDVDEMSFGFRVVRQEWSDDFDQRSLVEVSLNKGDVSAVNYGANPHTSVGLQTAFRSARPALLHRMAVEMRAGKALSAQTRDTLSQVLDLIAAADKQVDAAQPLLADLLGVPNPDDAEESAEPSEPAAVAATGRAVAYLDVLRRRLELEQEQRRRLVIGA